MTFATGRCRTWDYVSRKSLSSVKLTMRLRLRRETEAEVGAWAGPGLVEGWALGPELKHPTPSTEHPSPIPKHPPPSEHQTRIAAQRQPQPQLQPLPLIENAQQTSLIETLRLHEDLVNSDECLSIYKFGRIVTSTTRFDP